MLRFCNACPDIQGQKACLSIALLENSLLPNFTRLYEVAVYFDLCMRSLCHLAVACNTLEALPTHCHLCVTRTT